MRDCIGDAYSALRTVTPLAGMDCGRLCGGRCCKGSKNEGMELFHGEGERFKNDPSFTVKTDGGREILICSGHCDRRSRPLSCRMYPFFPIPVEEDGKVRIRVVYDLRGFATCPLIRDHIKPDPRFVRAVKLAGMYLARDPENLRILRETAALFEELALFTQTMTE